MIKKLFLGITTLFLLLLCNFSFLFAETTPSSRFSQLQAYPPDTLSGVYTISDSANLFNKPAYTGTVEITNKRSIYELIWNIPGSPQYKGVGIVVDDILCAGWSAGNSYGVVVYKVDGGRLKGQWANSGFQGIGMEDLEGPPELNGVYQIVNSVSPETSRGYSGNVTINKNGDVYLITWLLPNESYSGVGIFEDNLLIVGWGIGQTTGVVYYRIKDGVLLGRWTVPQAKKIGIENLTWTLEEGHFPKAGF